MGNSGSSSAADALPGRQESGTLDGVGKSIASGFNRIASAISGTLAGEPTPSSPRGFGAIDMRACCASTDSRVGC